MEVAQISEKFLKSNLSQRQFSVEDNIPRTTLQGHLKRLCKNDGDPVNAFFESSAGQVVIQQMMTALVFTFEISHNSGLRKLTQFLELSGFAEYVSHSKSSLAEYSKEMENLMIAFGVEQEEVLSKIMPDKKLAIMVDETFPANDICLVTMETTSGYLLAEKLSEDRSYDSWRKCLDETKKRLGIDSFTQIISDEAKALLKLAKEENAQHNTDLLHVLLEISKALSGRLASQKYQTQKLLDEAEAKLEKKKNHVSSSAHQRDARVKIAEKILAEAKALHQINIDLFFKYKMARNTISNSLHPYDIESGQVVTRADVEKALRESFDIINDIAKPYGEKALKRISKAEKLIPVLLDMICYYHHHTNEILENTDYSETQIRILKTVIIPALYMLTIAKKKKTPQERQRLENLSNTLMMQIWGEDMPPEIDLLTPQQLDKMLKTATSAVQLFQRSSSAVEGRNAQLNLQQHCRHKLSDRKLAALTVHHNFFIKREDGSTAAMRFFGTKHRCLFEFIKQNISKIGRSRKRNKLKWAS